MLNVTSMIFLPGREGAWPAMATWIQLSSPRRVTCRAKVLGLSSRMNPVSWTSHFAAASPEQPAYLATSFDDHLSPCQNPWAGVHLFPQASHCSFPPWWVAPLLCTYGPCSFHSLKWYPPITCLFYSYLLYGVWGCRRTQRQEQLKHIITAHL